MVVRHPACILYVSLLAAGLRPATARGLPHFVFGGSSAVKVSEATAQSRDRASALRREATGLQRGEGGQSCSLWMNTGRRGVWGLKAVTRPLEQASHLRGGALASDDSDEDFDEFDDHDDMDDGMMDEGDFGEANFLDRFKQDWKKTPIISRTFFQASIGLAVLLALFNKNQWPDALLLDWQPTIFKLQLWRLVAPFLHIGPLGFSSLVNTHFSWAYMSQLEKLHYREPHTFVMLLAFGMTSLVLITLIAGGHIESTYTLGHSFSSFLVMVWSRKFAGTTVNFLDMFELSTEWSPYFFAAQTLLMEGVIPWTDFAGLLVGYAWQTLTQKGLLKAPKPLVNLFRNNAFLRAEYARAGKEYGQEMPLHDDEDEAFGEETPAVEEKPGGEKRGRGVTAKAAGKTATKRGAGVGKKKRAPKLELASQDEVEEEETEEEETKGEETEGEETEGEETDEENEESSDGVEEGERDAADEDGKGYDSDDEAGETDSVDLEGEEEAEGGVESLFGEDEQLEDLEELDDEMESMLGDFEEDDFGDDDFGNDVLSGSFNERREEEAESDEN